MSGLLGHVGACAPKAVQNAVASMLGDDMAMRAGSGGELMAC